MIQKVIKEGYWVCLALMLITAPFFTNLNSYSIATFGLFWLLNKPTFNWRKQHLSFLLLVLGYYLVQIFGVINSSIPSEAFFHLEKKAGILIIPFFLATGPRLPIDRFKRIMRLYSLAMIGSACLFLAYATFDYFEYGTTSFYYHNLTEKFDVHAVYYSLALALALYFSLYEALNKSNTQRFLYAVFSVFIIIVLVLLSSKMLLPVISLTGVWLLFKSIKSKKAVLVASLIGFLSVLFLFGEGISKRVGDISAIDRDSFKTTDFKYDSDLNGLTLRYIFWVISFDILNEHNAFISGVGISDSEKYLNDEYKKRGLYTGNPNFNDVGYLGYNPHNQFIQEWLMNGLFGFLALCGMLFFSLILANKGPNYLFYFLILLTCFCISESMMQRQAGIVLFALIYGILINMKSKTNEPALL